MKRLEVRMIGLLLVPYGVVALTALAATSGPDAQPLLLAASVPVQGAHDYSHCQAQTRPDGAEPARQQRAQQAHGDPLSRSQSPGWVQRSRHQLEDCLRGRS